MCIGEMESNKQTFQLLSGQQMPLIGFGTYQIRGRELISEVLDWALAAGYRLIDTAAGYGNEYDIGLALKQLLPKYNLSREDIFITSKLSPSDHGDQAYGAVINSLKNLQLEYLDLYLIHWPGVLGISPHSSENATLRSASWAALTNAQKNGLVKNIGVSNYTVQHLSDLLKNSFGVKPAVNQVEWHPACHTADLKELCENEGILLQAYSSLGGTGNASLLQDNVVLGIANKLQKSPAQVLLRWALQQNIAVIPKARSKKHIENNIDLNFTISNEDMAILSNRKQERFAWDPNSVL